MLNLLIVDDEPLVQIGIISIIQNQSQIAINVCDTATNGLEALKKIQLYTPDIVICDIKMPVMDGLDLAAKCKSVYGKLPVFIMLTSYEEFHLAQKAIQCQVCDYLIKIDLTPDALIAALQKAATLVEEYSKNGYCPPTNTVNYRDNFFIRLLNHLIDESCIIQEAFNLSINLDYTNFVVVYGTIENMSTVNTNSDNCHTSYISTFNMLSEILKKYTDIYTTAMDINHFAILFCFTTVQHTTIKNILINALNDCIELIKNYFSIHLRLGIGSIVESPGEIYRSFSEAKEAEKYAEFDSFKVYQILLEERREFERNKLIFDIQQFIDNHLTYRLSLNSIATNFGISDGYLSSQFKKVTGISLTDYVNHQKIEYSKILLAEQKMKIYEIADHMGFENTYYYSKVFRRYAGCSPREYINKLIAKK